MIDMDFHNRETDATLGAMRNAAIFVLSVIAVVAYWVFSR